MALNHANLNGRSLGDASGYMGLSSRASTWPKRCYTASQHWKLGWFSGQKRSITPGTPVTIRVQAFAHASQGGIVLVQVGDVHLQYNRAVGMNADTGDRVNQIAIVRGNDSVAGLAAGDDYRLRVNGQNVVIRACRTRGTAMIVSVGVNGHKCDGSSTDVPTDTNDPADGPDDEEADNQDEGNDETTTCVRGLLGGCGSTSK